VISNLLPEVEVKSSFDKPAMTPSGEAYQFYCFA